jgi:hypothetical protein
MRQCSECGERGHFAKTCGRPRWPNGAVKDPSEVRLAASAEFLYVEWHIEAMGQPIEVFREWFSKTAGVPCFADWHLAFRREGWANKFLNISEGSKQGEVSEVTKRRQGRKRMVLR